MRLYRTGACGSRASPAMGKSPSAGGKPLFDRPNIIWTRPGTPACLRLEKERATRPRRMRRIIAFALCFVAAASTEADVLRASGRLPIEGAGLDGWKAPEICKRSPAVRPTPDAPAPGFFSKRVALIVNRLAFRGFGGLGDKHRYVATPAAVQMQLAISRTVLKNFVKPLERIGFHVDVFVATHSSPKLTPGLWEALVDSFGPNVVSTSLINGTSASSRDVGQSAAMREGLMLLERHMLVKNVTYRSVMIRRFDVALVKALGPSEPTTAFLDKLEAYESKPTLQLTGMRSSSEYALWASSVLGQSVDFTFAIPGWFLGCWFGMVLHGPELRDVEWWSEGGSLLSVPKVRDSLRAVSKNAGGYLPFDEVVYRGQYGQSHNEGGLVVCRYLRKEAQGPPCSAVYELRDLCAVEFRDKGVRLTDAFWLKYVEQFLKRVFAETASRKKGGVFHDAELASVMNVSLPGNDEIRVFGDERQFVQSHLNATATEADCRPRVANA
ncbi:hypothetical protein M885DRAFT_516873 [Pelagophyceae sp. CCMP2097]|nr:hypothetical protein M885DRAFT_516873 [Pelagophyceae sp. CCMP2097]